MAGRAPLEAPISRRSLAANSFPDAITVAKRLNALLRRKAPENLSTILDAADRTPLSREQPHGTTVILDDLDIRSSEDLEARADAFAQAALIPEQFASALSRPDFQSSDVSELARSAGVHQAVVAGRWQREHDDYRRFSKLVGHGEVRAVLSGADASQ